jgi:predicted Mrr-cat superfamily restriction endonuclease
MFSWKSKPNAKANAKANANANANAISERKKMIAEREMAKIVANNERYDSIKKLEGNAFDQEVDTLITDSPDKLFHLKGLKARIKCQRENVSNSNIEKCQKIDDKIAGNSGGSRKSRRKSRRNTRRKSNRNR